jgi:hypothetical protein
LVNIKAEMLVNPAKTGPIKTQTFLICRGNDKKSRVHFTTELVTIRPG